MMKGVVSIKRRTETKDMDVMTPFTKSYQGPDANAVNEHNGYRMDAVLFISAGSPNQINKCRHDNHLMHKK